MTFTNPASGAAAAAGEYTRQLLELLGGREPLPLMQQLAARVRAAGAGLTPEQWRRPEAPGKWSCLQVVGHLVDTEIVYGYRVRCVVAHDRPALPGYDQDRWTERLRHNEADPATMVDRLAFLRAMNLEYYSGLTADERRRAGLHSERGEESVDHILRLLAAHDLVHRAQLQRVRRALGLAATDDLA